MRQAGSSHPCEHGRARSDTCTLEQELVARAQEYVTQKTNGLDVSVRQAEEAAPEIGKQADLRASLGDKKGAQRMLEDMEACKTLASTA